MGRKKGLTEDDLGWMISSEEAACFRSPAISLACTRNVAQSALMVIVWINAVVACGPDLTGSFISHVHGETSYLDPFGERRAVLSRDRENPRPQWARTLLRHSIDTQPIGSCAGGDGTLAPDLQRYKVFKSPHVDLRTAVLAPQGKHMKSLPPSTPPVVYRSAEKHGSKPLTTTAKESVIHQLCRHGLAESVTEPVVESTLQLKMAGELHPWISSRSKPG